MALIDLSHTVEHGMTTYPGLPGPVVCDFLTREASRATYAEGVTFHIGRIEMIANTGTYVDAPFHRYPGGIDLAELPLERLANLPGVVVDVTGGEREIGPEHFDGLDLEGRAVLVCTDGARHWRTERYGVDAPYLNEAAASYLLGKGVAFVGIDGINVDDRRDPSRPVHSILLGGGVPIGEHLRGLEALPQTGFRFHAVPVKVRGLGTFPVRAYGVTED
jgi:kynurenine formamidase